ncbi:glucose-1-phosphate cytidylyltransferase [Hymenobacter luteus]|uniref:Glucose-1-phosphate cytidylyltransferase n=2 Tax=Hymenobacter TaxID=89966 RepID=A0A7W9SZE4_9BACT|nr:MULTISPECIES: glucose-1-phosphate cytidylyltransferase [Hymenobacter]MBB4601067.1 glucose-1-phosphate cytidylyltransferase [Hymenobacter latericoloratus]MBB6058726.1 glucose-1-phosphate cytidylyltransferase [Hymenobacter luteus]
MKAVILAGGYGTRISEESGVRPKPMVEIGGRPILWHIMKIYAHHGIRDFVICCGYKGHLIKQYFSDYFLHNSDVTFRMDRNEMQIHRNHAEPWTVTLVDTGQETMTGGRLRRVREYVENETFCLTYGDGVGDVDIREAVRYHRQQGALATLTAVRQPGRFGVFNLQDSSSLVSSFTEKPEGGETPWINGGFFVLEPAIFDYIDGDDTVWEKAPLERLAAEGRLAAFRHTGFWQPMDTLRDKNMLEEMWQQGRAQWKVWSNAPESAEPDPVLADILASPVVAPLSQRVAAPTIMPAD